MMNKIPTIHNGDLELMILGTLETVTHNDIGRKKSPYPVMYTISGPLPNIDKINKSSISYDMYKERSLAW